MSRALIFHHGSTGTATDLAFGLEKIDRRKLYGYVDTEVVDGAGRACDTALLAGDGRTLIGRGGSALALLDVDGNYLDKASLTPIGPAGTPLSRVPSSFDAPIALHERASIDSLLNHNIKAAYALTPPMSATELLAELRGGAIYTFPFSFRGGLDPDVGFLVANPDGVPFLLLGKPTRLEFVSLAEIADPEADETVEPDSDDGDEVDFAMM